MLRAAAQMKPSQRRRMGSNESHPSLRWQSKCHRLFFGIAFNDINVRGNERSADGYEERCRLDSENNPALSVSFGLEFAVGQQRVAGEQIFSQLWEIFTHLPEMCEYVWAIFTHLWEMWLSLNVTALNLIKPLTIKSLLFSRVSAQIRLSYYALLRAAWVGNALSFISWLLVKVI